VFFISACVKKSNNIGIVDNNPIGSEILLRVSANEGEFQYDNSTSPDGFISYSWYYEARVLDVIQGTYTSKHIKFSHGQVSQYRKGLTKNWIILVRKLSNIEPKYGIIDHAFSHDFKKIEDLKNDT